jgi:hypothetical protein
LVVGSETGSIQILSIAYSKELDGLVTQGSIRDLKTVSKERILSLSNDTISLWDIPSRTMLKKFAVSADCLVTFSSI